MDDDLAKQTATIVMDTFHAMMQNVGSEARRRSAQVLSMQQFRAMKTLEHHDGVSLSLLSEHLGTTLSAASKLVDGLVDRGYVQRENAEDDRRRLILGLTQEGIQAMRDIHMELITCLSERLTSLTVGECGLMKLAMEVLRSALMAPVSASEQSKQRSE